MRHIILFTTALFAFTFGIANADVFRCTGSDGKTEYQESPCSIGVEKALDNQNQRQRDQAAKTKKDAADLESKQKAEFRGR